MKHVLRSATRRQQKKLVASYFAEMNPDLLRSALELPQQDTFDSGEVSLQFGGWIGIPTGLAKITALEVIPHPKAAEVRINLKRADVAHAYGDSNLIRSGFRIRVVFAENSGTVRLVAHFADGKRFELRPTADVQHFMRDFVNQDPIDSAVCGYIDGCAPDARARSARTITVDPSAFLSCMAFDLDNVSRYLSHAGVKAWSPGVSNEIDQLRLVAQFPLQDHSPMVYRSSRVLQGDQRVNATVLMPQSVEPRSYLVTTTEPRVHVENKSVVAFGGLIYDDCGNVLIDDPASRPELDFVAGRWDVMRGSFLRLGEVMVRRHGEVTHELPTGATLLGRVPFNYFHSLIEYLPRLETLRAGGLSNDVPLLINDELPSAALEALDLVSEGWETIRIKRDDVVKVDELWIPTFHTDHKDSTVEPWWKGAAFHWPTLDSFRRRILEKIDAPIGDRRVMLVRGRGSTTARGLRNIDKLAEIAQEMGFSILDPAELSFVDQVKMIRSAGTLISPGGAAFANLLFAHDQLRVLGLVSHQLSDFAIHANLARHAGASFRYLTGPSLVSPRKVTYHREYFHADFKISPRDFTREIKELCATR